MLRARDAHALAMRAPSTHESEPNQAPSRQRPQLAKFVGKVGKPIGGRSAPIRTPPLCSIPPRLQCDRQISRRGPGPVLLDTRDRSVLQLDHLRRLATSAGNGDRLSNPSTLTMNKGPLGGRPTQTNQPRQARGGSSSNQTLGPKSGVHFRSSCIPSSFAIQRDTPRTFC